MWKLERKQCMRISSCFFFIPARGKLQRDVKEESDQLQGCILKPSAGCFDKKSFPGLFVLLSHRQPMNVKVSSIFFGSSQVRIFREKTYANGTTNQNLHG